jgi:histidine transport system permease protein
MFFFIMIAALGYLVITTASNIVLLYLERRYSTGVRHADL